MMRISYITLHIPFLRKERTLKKLKQGKINIQGPVTRAFEESKKETKIREESHFSDEN